MREAVRLAMAILVDLAQGVGAAELVEIEHVHSDSGFYLGNAGMPGCHTTVFRNK